MKSTEQSVHDSSSTDNGGRRRAGSHLLVGVSLGALAVLAWSAATRSPGASGGDLEDALGIGALLRQAHADLPDGDYQFFPNRRTIWVVNRENGRMANYFFRDDEVQTVDRSRVATIDLGVFPRDETRYVLSDRNLNNILWVCNVRTGDVQMWQPSRDGTLRAIGPFPTSSHLTER